MKFIKDNMDGFKAIGLLATFFLLISPAPDIVHWITHSTGLWAIVLIPLWAIVAIAWFFLALFIAGSIFD